MQKILKSLVTITAVAAIAIGATGAYFSSTVASSGNSFSAGTMILEINDQNPTATAVFNASDLYPGADIAQQSFKVENTGTINGHHLNLTVTIDNDNDLAKNIVFDPTGIGLRFGATQSGSDSENLVEEIIAPMLGDDYLVTKSDGSGWGSSYDIDGDGTLSLSELAAAGTIRITPEGNNEGIFAGTTAYLWMNTSVKTDLVTQGETVNATFTWELQQDAS